MSEPSDAFSHLLAQFTGASGSPEHAIVYYTIAAIFWATLLVIIRTKQTLRTEPHEYLLIWGFSVALARELLMIVVSGVVAFGIFTSEQLAIVFPPLERALSNIALVVVAGGFLLFLTNKEAISRLYIRVGVWAVIACYVATFWWWAAYIIDNPDSTFSQTWCEWLFRINASFWLGLALITLASGTRGWVRRLVCFSLLLFFLNEFLKIPDMVSGGHYAFIYTPIRQAMYLLAIPVLGYVYLKQMTLEVGQAFTVLDERVQERSKDLETAMRQLADANERLVDLSNIDPLTGVTNRRFFNETYAVEWQRAYRDASSLSVLMLDIDHFKRVNDVHGVGFGDHCLRKVAEAMQSVSARPADVIARYGGEEFVMLLPNTPKEGALIVAERIRAKVESLALQPSDTADSSVQINVSIGAASIRPRGQADLAEFIEQAEQALHQAKENGRNQVRFFESPDRPKPKRRKSTILSRSPF